MLHLLPGALGEELGLARLGGKLAFFIGFGRLHRGAAIAGRARRCSKAKCGKEEQKGKNQQFPVHEYEHFNDLIQEQNYAFRPFVAPEKR